MNFKTTYILFGILAVVIGIFAVTLILGPGGPGDTGFVLSSLHEPGHELSPGEIDTLEIERSRPTAEKITVVRDPATGSWKLTQPLEWPADASTVDAAISEVIGARKYERADLNSNLQEWGLQPPAAVVTIKKGNEARWTLNLGNQREGVNTAAVYVTSSDHPGQPVAVKRSDLGTLLKGVTDFRSKILLASSALNILAVQLDEPGHEAIVLDKGSAGQWRFEKPARFGEADFEGTPAAAGATAGGITGVRDLLADIEQLRVESDADFVADNVHDWGRYGLGTPSLQITVKHRVGGELGGDEKRAPVQATLLIGKKADDKGEKFYARLEGTDAVVRVRALGVEPVLKVAQDPSVLRSRDLVHLDQGRVDAVNIKNGAGLLKLRRIRGDWKIYDSAGKAVNANEQAVQKLLGALNARRLVVSFPDPAQEATMGFDKPQAVISIWEGGIQAEATKDQKAGAPKAVEAEPRLKEENKPTVQLTFGKTEDKQVDVLRVGGGNQSVLGVPATLLAQVQQGRLAYLDTTLPSFSATAAVTRLVIDRGGKRYELLKDDKKPGAWQLKEPQDATLRPADRRDADRIVDDLRELSAERLVAEDPKEAELEPFGLRQPRLKAVVTVRTDSQKTVDHAYLFGKDTEGGVYALEGTRNLVFVARPQVVADLQAELRDRTLFRFQPAQVKDIRLDGWKQVYKTFSMSLELERLPDHTWKVKKGPENFQLNQEAVEAFLRELTDPDRPLIERFLEGGVKPEYKLGKDDRALELQLTVGEEKSPQTWTIGALDPAAKAYYSQSSGLPNEVFLVPQDRLEKLLQGVEYFSQPPK